MFEQRGHLPASYSEWSDSYQRPRGQCPRAELQGQGVGWVKGELELERQRINKIENSKVKE